jgi:hypothetical protein
MSYNTDFSYFFSPNWTIGGGPEGQALNHQGVISGVGQLPAQDPAARQQFHETFSDCSKLECSSLARLSSLV